MSKAIRSVALTANLHDNLVNHLLRRDGQEDLCFALWYPSKGKERYTALLHTLILPENGERNVHGNVSFEPSYFERAMCEAAAMGAGLALLHSHPRGVGWQDMSLDDITAESESAGPVLGATGLPFLGLTLGKDKKWSARFWERIRPRTYGRVDCATVRVVGSALECSYYDVLAPEPSFSNALLRTISAWGDAAQRDLARLRVGVVGCGSVGGFVGESLARMGFEDVTLIDFDSIEPHNLDRLTYANVTDVGKLKVESQAQHLRRTATVGNFRIHPVASSVCQTAGYEAALDCDILFSCVDRPWGRSVLNQIAYGHLIPVVDGGILVRTNRFGLLSGADWKAHIAGPQRECLQCMGQYDPAMVQMEREGFLDDPSYIQGLEAGHPLKARENVFAFAMSCASMQILQMLAMVIAPLGLSDQGTQLYHFVGGEMEKPVHRSCHENCQFPARIALGDRIGRLSLVQDGSSSQMEVLLADLQYG